MDSLSEKYRKHAEDCITMTDFVPDHLRQSLDEVATAWLALAEQASPADDGEQV